MDQQQIANFKQQIDVTKAQVANLQQQFALKGGCQNCAGETAGGALTECIAIGTPIGKCIAEYEVAREVCQNYCPQ